MVCLSCFYIILSRMMDKRLVLTKDLLIKQQTFFLRPFGRKQPQVAEGNSMVIFCEVPLNRWHVFSKYNSPTESQEGPLS